MKRDGITYWIAPCADAHQSEYIGSHDACVRFLSGFTGDSCTLLVTDHDARLWTDGRYFVQAEKELSGSSVTLMRMGEPEVPALTEYLDGILRAGDAVGFFAPYMSSLLGNTISGIAEKHGASLVTKKDPVDAVWENRPGRSAGEIWLLGEEYTGESAAEKVRELREEMKRAGCTAFVTGALDETAWITNLRGSDIACNPVFLSYFLLRRRSAVLYVQEKALSTKAAGYLGKNGIEVRNYDSFPEDLKKLRGERILLDPASTSYALSEILSGKNRILEDVSPAAVLKTVKTETEQDCLTESHIRDGVYMTKFLCWIKERVRNAPDGSISETDAAEHLDALRASDKKFVSLSFPTISAYGANAALPHYMPEKESAAKLHRRGLYLVDSGAHYLDGTTDVTRTIALGETTPEERWDYTLTVIGMLNLMTAVFPYGVRGMNLDTFARAPLWAYGRDFNHGTGHGIGFCNTVHEPPTAIRFHPSADPRRDRPFVPGMVTSDEPGIYVENQYGIRTENQLLCVPHPAYEGSFAFRPLTLVPLDPDPLEVSLMTKEDRKRFNAYQELVRKVIGPQLTKEERQWLRNETRKIRKPAGGTGKRKKTARR